MGTSSWPGAEAAPSFLVRLLVAGPEQARQRGVRHQGQHPALAQELLGVVERVEGSVRGQPALEGAAILQLAEGWHDNTFYQWGMAVPPVGYTLGKGVLKARGRA